MEMAMSIYRKESEDEQRTKKGKRKKVDLFVFLPDDILSDILERLSDDFLRYKAKLVCRRWMDLIKNRNLLDRASFILRGFFTARHVGIREEGEEGLQVKAQDLDMPFKGDVRSWGNEFLLYSLDYKGTSRSLYVYNLITKEGSYLPNCDAPCGGYCISKCGVAISFDRFKGIYKVVHLFTGSSIECHILILREDIVSSKWKKIQLPYMNGLWQRWLSIYPVSVQGRYIHWRVYDDDKRLITMDMVKEEIFDSSLSLPLTGDGSREIGVNTIFEMGGSLALFAGVSEDEAEIWILNDLRRNKWDKLQSVTLKDWYRKRFPVCGVMSNSNRYIILKSDWDGGMWYYDLKNGVVKKLDINIDFFDLCLVHSSPPSFK